MTITEVDAKEADIEKYADVCPRNTGGYHTLTRDEVIEIYRRSLKSSCLNSESKNSNNRRKGLTKSSHNEGR